jgi:hypothetical protein
MDKDALKFKANESRILIIDIEIMLRRMEQVMMRIKNDDKSREDLDKLLECLDRDYALWNQKLSYNINDIRGMLQK